jgi:hypothetical protein
VTGEIHGPELLPGPDRDMSQLINVVTSTMMGSSVSLGAGLSASKHPDPATLSETYSREDALTEDGGPHPCNPIERVPPEFIWEVYGDLEDNSPRTMWRDLDLLLCEGGRDVERSFSELRSRLDVFCNEHRPKQHMPWLTNQQPKGEAIWYDAAMLRAALPAFRDRLLNGEVNTQAAQDSYQMLVNDVLPYIQNSGTCAEVIVAALLARIDPEAYAFPSSLREERSRHKSPDGKLFNHDLYQLPHVDSPKVPLQVKLTGGGDNRMYDKSVIRVYVHQWLIRPVLGRDYQRVHPRQANNPVVFLDYLRSAFDGRLRNGEEMLHNAALSLDDRILRCARSSTEIL